MERLKTAARAILILGLPLTTAFGSAVKSEAAPPDQGSCLITQTKADEVIVVCPYPYHPEADIEKIKKKCLVTGTEIYGHRSSMRAWLSTPLQKNCWGPSIKDYIRTVIKNPPRTQLHPHP